MSDLFEFFSKLEREEWSGEIQVTASEGHATVILEGGRLVYACRPMDRAAERLSKLPWIKMPPDTVTNACKTWEEFVKRVITLNIHDADKLIRFLKTDRLELFFRIFFWTNVELIPRAYEVDIASNQDLSFYTKRDLKKLIQEAQTRIQEWPVIQKKIGSGRRIFVSRITRAEWKARSANSRDAIDSAIEHFEGDSRVTGPQPYSEEQLQLLELCNGSNSVQEIVRLSADGEFLTLRRLLDLWDKGMIIPKEEESGIRVIQRSNRLHWKDLRAIVLLVGVFCSLILLAHGSLPRPPKNQITSDLIQALELHRIRFGRYPVTLQELTHGIPLIGLEYNRFDYRLLNLNQYQIKAVTDEP